MFFYGACGSSKRSPARKPMYRRRSTRKGRKTESLETVLMCCCCRHCGLASCFSFARVSTFVLFCNLFMRPMSILHWTVLFSAGIQVVATIPFFSALGKKNTMQYSVQLFSQPKCKWQGDLKVLRHRHCQSGKICEHSTRTCLQVPCSP